MRRKDPLPGAYVAAIAELATVRDWLRFAVSRFESARLVYGHGTQHAYDEAAYLLLHTLSLPLDRLEPFLDARLVRSERDALARVIARRVEERMPAPYITREAWLGDHRFYVDERVIVPRSFIAELLAERLSPWVQSPQEIGAVLDMCTGSGCLAVLAALAFPAAGVDAVDISRDALEVAARNVADYRLEERVRLIRSDLFTGLGNAVYDVILANPPYVSAAAMRSLPAEYRHEPRAALASGRDGLDATRVLLEQAPAHLCDDGLLVVEIGHNRDALEAAFPRLPFTWLETSAGDSFVFLLRRREMSNS